MFEAPIPKWFPRKERRITVGSALLQHRVTLKLTRGRGRRVRKINYKSDVAFVGKSVWPGVEIDT